MGSYRWTEIRERLARCSDCGGELQVVHMPVHLEDGRVGLFKRFTCPPCDEKRRDAVFSQEEAAHD